MSTFSDITYTLSFAALSAEDCGEIIDIVEELSQSRPGWLVLNTDQSDLVIAPRDVALDPECFRVVARLCDPKEAGPDELALPLPITADGVARLLDKARIRLNRTPEEVSSPRLQVKRAPRPADVIAAINASLPPGAMPPAPSAAPPEPPSASAVHDMGAPPPRRKERIEPDAMPGWSWRDGMDVVRGGLDMSLAYPISGSVALAPSAFADIDPATLIRPVSFAPADPARARTSGANVFDLAAEPKAAPLPVAEPEPEPAPVMEPVAEPVPAPTLDAVSDPLLQQAYPEPQFEPETELSPASVAVDPPPVIEETEPAPPPPPPTVAPAPELELAPAPEPTLAPIGAPMLDDAWAEVAMMLYSVMHYGNAVIAEIGIAGTDVIQADFRYRAFVSNVAIEDMPIAPRHASIRTMKAMPDWPPAFALPGQPIEKLLWYVGTNAFGGAPAPWLRADARYRLQKWPNFAEFAYRLEHMRMTALLANGFLTATELAAAAAVQPDLAVRMINAFSLMGLLDVAHDASGALHQALDNPAFDEADASEYRRTNPLIAKLQAKLGLG